MNPRLIALACVLGGATAHATEPPMPPDVDRDAHITSIHVTEKNEVEVRLHGVTLNSSDVVLEIDDRARYGSTSEWSMGPGLQGTRVTTATFDDDALPWDGHLHAYVVRVWDHRFGPWFLALPEREEESDAWRWLVIAVAAATAIGVGFALDRRRRTAAA